ncbi:cation efflux protein [Mollisia scopiformis]|uniref:Zinc transporter n=1 Tax=Mollisia scopiformis TaxID=149040 RepID=A0A194XAA6_MOLSC|nr:cation efflux protein [Mollisia scopiformis]KUJ16697.1 cation efflux protein [Mollisia scopiformis]
MASTYALPASAMTHSHGHNGHLHSHSHSHSPSRQYSASTPRTLKTERSNGNLHSHSCSDTNVDLNHAHSYNHSHSHSHSHSHEREPSYSGYPPPILSSNDLPPTATLEKHNYEVSPAASQIDSFEPLNSANVIPHDHGHLHPLALQEEPRSRFTSFILPLTLPWPLLHIIMANMDSRRIFYFMCLNFSFMLVQAFYGYLTDSLGLLSDSIHMFFDCLALGVGLFASIASKWPPSERFPYGFGKIESLSGFANAVFLMLISIEILAEAAERLIDGRETKRLAELFVVSGLGLAVNLVGMACFGHHGHHHDHGGHSHGHSNDHSHSHSHSDEKSHSHLDCSHDHDHDNMHDHDHGHGDHSSHSHSPLLMPPSPSKEKVHVHTAHSHSHANENMHGIFLHVLADTMGSAAVMVSTALIYFTKFNGWDPIASCVIAILIFFSSIPLLKSSARKLLLTVPDEAEYTLRDTLAGVSDLRGVQSYNVPRFWMGENTGSENATEQVLGVMHIIATRGSDLDDVKERATDFLRLHGVDVVVQVEHSHETSCWCGGAAGSRSPSLY